MKAYLLSSIAMCKLLNVHMRQVTGSLQDAETAPCFLQGSNRHIPVFFKERWWNCSHLCWSLPKRWEEIICKSWCLLACPGDHRDRDGALQQVSAFPSARSCPGRAWGSWAALHTSSWSISGLRNNRKSCFMLCTLVCGVQNIIVWLTCTIC